MNDHERAYRPQNPRSPLPGAVVLVILALAAFFGWHWWQGQQMPLHQAVSTAPSGPDDRPAEPAGVPPDAGPHHPVTPIAQPESGLPPLDQADDRVRDALLAWLGAGRVAEFLQLDGFVRRVVATVDNLPRHHAPPSRWPVRVTPGRVVLAGDGDLRTLSPENAARYLPLVRFAESIDSAGGARLYARLYPLFQSAYEELGYPGRYFNDRLIAAIDHMLAAPLTSEPIAIRLVEVRGDIPSERPWVRYEFADPRWEALSAGHKLMLRMGPDNAQRIKAVMQQWRAQLARTADRPAQ